MNTIKNVTCTVLIGLTLLGGAIVAWGAVEPAAPGVAVTVGLHTL